MEIDNSKLILKDTNHINEKNLFFMKSYNEIEEFDNALCTDTNNIITLSCKSKIPAMNWFNYIEMNEEHVKIWSVDLRTLEQKYNIERNSKKDLQENIISILCKIGKEKELGTLEIIKSVAETELVTEYLFSLSGIQEINYSTEEELKECIKKFHLDNIGFRRLNKETEATFKHQQ